MNSPIVQSTHGVTLAGGGPFSARDLKLALKRAPVAVAADSGADRLLGSFFGLARGVVVALVVCTLVSMTPLAKWEPWQASRGVAWLQIFMTGLRPVLPEQVIKFLPEQS